MFAEQINEKTATARFRILLSLASDGTTLISLTVRDVFDIIPAAATHSYRKCKA